MAVEGKEGGAKRCRNRPLERKTRKYSTGQAGKSLGLPRERTNMSPSPQNQDTEKVEPYIEEANNRKKQADPIEQQKTLLAVPA